jgi:hypothetical protein
MSSQRWDPTHEEMLNYEDEQYFVLFFTNGKITKTDFYDSSDEAFSAAEIHADFSGPNKDAVVFEVVEDRPIHVRSY